MFAVIFATFARSDFEPESISGPTLIVAAAAVGMFTAAAWATRLHDGRCALGSIDEVILLGGLSAVIGSLIHFANLLADPPFVPRSVPLVAALFALVVMAWGRAMVRRIRENAMSGRRTEPGEPVLVIGAGEGGRQLIHSMRRDPRSRWHPVGLLDDNPQRRHLRIEGVPVLGAILHLASIAKELGVTTIVVAIPSADAILFRHISRLASDSGLTVKVLPGVNDLLNGRAGIRDVRDIDLPDLLGRHQIDTDVASIAGYLEGKRVLVTGAGGSIGSELCRQIHRWKPASLIMLDRDESALHALQLSIEGRALLDSPDVVLADIRDEPRILEIFRERRPEVVFHAAALKHLPMLEQYPSEAVKSNIWGTLSVLEAAQAAHVQLFVNISTDKAANPVSVLGYTKRIAEGLTASMAAEADGTYLSVRFGNVLGSRGSVLTAFAAQIAAGGPVTVTHPDVTRYFMTVDEAVQLVIQAAATGRDGEALVLDMGKAVKIDDVAHYLIDLSGEEIDIEYTGLRYGEKMNEDLFSIGEPDHRPVHPLVSHVDVPPVDSLTVQSIVPGGSRESMVAEMQAICQRMSAEVVSVGAVQRFPPRCPSWPGWARCRDRSLDRR